MYYRILACTMEYEFVCKLKENLAKRTGANRKQAVAWMVRIYELDLVRRSLEFFAHHTNSRMNIKGIQRDFNGIRRQVGGI